MSAAGPQESLAPTYRLLTPADIPGAQRLRELAKWNQTEQDWRNLLAFDPRGCFGAELDGALVGTATAIRFIPERGRGSFGWVGMVLVDPEKRRFGIGSTLLKKCIAYLQASGVETVKLDATPLGKQVYDKLGFTDEYKLERWEGEAQKVPGGVYGPWTLSALAASDLDPLTAYDTPVFGAQRRAVLQAWREGWPECAVVAREGSRITGYGLARRGSSFHQIGPLIGDSPGLCEALLMHLLEQLQGERVIVDLVTEHPWSVPLAKRCNLRHQRPFIRMALGPNSSPGQLQKVLAICCPEVG